MHATITGGKNIKITSSLREHIESKMERIKFFSNNIIDVHVYLTQTNMIYQCEAVIHLEGRTFRCAKKDKTIHGSVDAMIDALEKKLQRTKEIARNHKHPSIAEAAKLLSEDEHHVEDVEDVHIVVHPIPSKPMDDVEALLEFQQSHKHYFGYFEIEKGEDMMSVTVNPHPVFLFKPSADEFIRYVYKKEPEGIFSRILGSQPGWLEKRVTAEGGKMNVINRKKVTIPESNVTAATHTLKENPDLKYLVFRNIITGRYECMYRENDHKFSLLRYGD